MQARSCSLLRPTILFWAFSAFSSRIGAQAVNRIAADNKVAAPTEKFRILHPDANYNQALSNTEIWNANRRSFRRELFASHLSMTAASYRKPCLTRWSWVVNRSCQAHLEHQAATRPTHLQHRGRYGGIGREPCHGVWRICLSVSRATPGVLLRESRVGTRRNDQAR